MVVTLPVSHARRLLLGASPVSSSLYDEEYEYGWGNDNVKESDNTNNALAGGLITLPARTLS
jgi:hypothetical protein